jgi:hypothetical protein
MYKVLGADFLSTPLWQFPFSNSPAAIHFPSSIHFLPSTILLSAIYFPPSAIFPLSKSLPPKLPFIQMASLHPKVSHHQKASSPPSVSLLYPVLNKEVEQQFSGRDMTCNKRN